MVDERIDIFEVLITPSVLDPLGGLAFTDDDYHWITRELMAAADASANGRVVSVLEGGYSLQALASASAAHVRALMQA